ncbi:MAG: radical SAM protein [bacterium]|uniref:Radical SAM protein n=1 Tax=Candidatus Methylomirabilis tolerans TaxID=3123416 RepID=A0AAJ1EK82_9BACT|nr:radical SAM protein [Candidatus Methylomirabilis sp.]
MIGQLIETGCRATPGLGRWYLDHYVSIKRLEKQVRCQLGFPAPPSSVTLLVTYACNFGCEHCESTSHPMAERGLSFETIARLIREMREMGVKVLIISGGEPLVRPDLFEIIGVANRQGLKVLLCTNGSLVEQRWEQLASAQLDCIFTSVDGLEETNDRFRHHPGAFKQTFRALELFQTMGVRSRMVNTMVHPDNLEELEELGDWIMDSAATVWRIALALPSGRARGLERFCLTDDQIRLVLRFIRDRRTHFPVYLSEEVGYVGPWALQVRSKPFSSGDGLSHFAIMPTGDVIGSGVLHDATYSEGNVKEQSLKEIWHHGFQRYRQPTLPQDCYACRHVHACGGGTFGMRVGDRHCNKRLWEKGGNT